MTMTLDGTNNAGIHNSDLKQSHERLVRGRTYKDLSTVCIIPTRGKIAARVVQSWWAMMLPMNQKFTRIVMENMEVGDAYSKAIESILDHPELSTWKYILTLEEDNAPPQDGLMKLLESIEAGPKWAAVGGLYWTKGECGQPMIYGSPRGILDFVPQLPQANKVQECNGLGMGFTLFRMDLFRDERIPRPWFRTVQNTQEGAMTQDLYFFKNIRELGYRVASDNRVRVGHWDQNTGMMW